MNKFTSPLMIDAILNNTFEILQGDSPYGATLFSLLIPVEKVSMEAYLDENPYWQKSPQFYRWENLIEYPFPVYIEMIEKHSFMLPKLQSSDNI